MSKPSKTARIRAKRRKARLMNRAMAGAMMLLIVALLTGSVMIGNSIRTSGGFAAVVSSMLVELANNDRNANDLSALTVSPTLVAVAQAKADDMAAHSYFAHTSPDGKDPWYWFKQSGYQFSYAGENLAIDFSDSTDVERAWMNSPAHRANILNSHFTEIGIATAVGYYEGHKTTFVVQEFGTPAQAAAPIATQNVPEAPTTLASASTQVSAPAPQPKAVAKPIATTTTTVTHVLGVAEAADAQSIGILPTVTRTVAASPKTALKYAYYLVGIVILIALLIETGLEWRRHHVRHMALALALLLFMVAAFAVANQYLFSTPVIGDAGTHQTG